MTKENYDDIGKYNFTNDNIKDYIYNQNGGSSLINSQVQTLVNGTNGIVFNGNPSGGNSSQPTPTPSWKMYWTVNLDLSSFKGSLKALLSTVTHELQHGVDFVKIDECSLATREARTLDARQFNQNYRSAMKAGDLTKANYWYNKYATTPSESSAFDTSRHLREEQGW